MAECFSTPPTSKREQTEAILTEDAWQGLLEIFHNPQLLELGCSGNCNRNPYRFGDRGSALRRAVTVKFQTLKKRKASGLEIPPVGTPLSSYNQASRGNTSFSPPWYSPERHSFQTPEQALSSPAPRLRSNMSSPNSRKNPERKIKPKFSYTLGFGTSDNPNAIMLLQADGFRQDGTICTLIRFIMPILDQADKTAGRYVAWLSTDGRKMNLLQPILPAWMLDMHTDPLGGMMEQNMPKEYKNLGHDARIERHSSVLMNLASQQNTPALAQNDILDLNFQAEIVNFINYPDQNQVVIAYELPRGISCNNMAFNAVHQEKLKDPYDLKVKFLAKGELVEGYDLSRDAEVKAVIQHPMIVIDMCLDPEDDRRDKLVTDSKVSAQDDTSKFGLGAMRASLFGMSGTAPGKSTSTNKKRDAAGDADPNNSTVKMEEENDDFQGEY